jgi:nitrile hydratase
MTQRFAPGAAVRVRRAFPIGHVRAPFYIRGKSGAVERYCGRCPNPEERAVGREDGPQLGLYRVRFRQREVWPAYRGNPEDSLDVEIYENWLEPA